MDTADDLLRDARTRLAGAPRESLGLQRTSRWRGDRIVRAGSAWHLGVLLLTDDGVLSTAEILRAAEPVRRGYAADSARARAERRAQARRGGFAEGEVVHVAWQVLDVAAVDAGGASGPLATVDGVPSVRWSPGGALVPLRGYLDERIALLLGA
ncbi:glutaminase [Microbacterium esteraromaticum]|uniref:Glutaminase n=1 Tax=Microbacterium esteraromaticum TaxID=57043 RepID=A0A7D7W596_9MICO|nr:glutaminase [Microbacterium esteraromaticum]QMU96236.1 glutaminase [Microbacterium esteraromaticum]